jgi:hypothetical protein
VTTLGIGALPVLFSKKKKHYLTVAYQDQASGDNVAVFELAKDVVKTTLPKLEARTGKKILHEGAPGEEDYARKRDNSADKKQQASTVPQEWNGYADRGGGTNAASTASMPPMGNAEVIQMVTAGVRQDIILTTIRNSEPHFHLTPSAMEYMMKSGVSENLIKAMAGRQNGR